jgi:hypothetical protein
MIHSSRLGDERAFWDFCAPIVDTDRRTTTRNTDLWRPSLRVKISRLF